MTALFAPEERRDDLFALYAFNYEIARVREITSEAMLGQMRLQWWRDSLEGIYSGGAIRRHEVVEPLATAIRRHNLDRSALERLIDAREADLAAEQPRTLGELIEHCRRTSSDLLLLALDVLGARQADADETVKEIGIAYALVGLIRALPFHLRSRRVYLPADLMAEAGLKLGDLLELRRTPEVRAAVERMALAASDYLRKGREPWDIPKSAMAALLPATLAGIHLRRLARVGYDPLDPSLAKPVAFAPLRLALAAATGRY